MIRPPSGGFFVGELEAAMSEIEQLRKELRELRARVAVLECRRADVPTIGWRTPPPQILPIPRMPEPGTVIC